MINLKQKLSDKIFKKDIQIVAPWFHRVLSKEIREHDKRFREIRFKMARRKNQEEYE